MFRSMTAFGRATADVGDRQITVEIRSVINRYLDCAVRLARSMSYFEEMVKPYILSRGVSRGKVEVTVSVQSAAEEEPVIRVDHAYAKAYLEALYELRDTYILADDISVMTLANNPAVFTAKRPPTAQEQLQKEAEEWESISAVLAQATDAFLQARLAEGERIRADLSEKFRTITDLINEIEALSAKDAATYRDRLAERIRSLLADLHTEADETRLLTECAVAADKMAIDEELVRLRSHLCAYENFASQTQPVGRSIDFLLQEMNREINTIGSKCANAQIAHKVVDVKTELEKVREQIQNIE